MHFGTSAPATARDLAGYLCEHPQASDTAEGIRRWWLAEPDFVPANDVEEALSWMHAQGLIEEVAAADGRLRYRRSGSDALLRSVAGSVPPRGH